MTDHVREAATPTDLLIEGGETGHVPGYILADCSCGGWYFAKAGGDEFAALEAAHEVHVDSTKKAMAAVREYCDRAERRTRLLPPSSSVDEGNTG